MSPELRDARGGRVDLTASFLFFYLSPFAHIGTHTLVLSPFLLKFTFLELFFKDMFM